jgi:hypothetical protein
MVGDIALRFLVGGVVVSLFAALGDLFKPKSFAGLFGAAPSVAIATLGLTILKEGKNYASVEAQSMIVGAIAFFMYARCLAWLLMRWKPRTLTLTISLLPLWFAVAFGIYGTVRVLQ